MTAGRVIVLNGTSSAGKTTLARALRARLTDAGECWMVIGIDDVMEKVPRAWFAIGDHVGARAEDGLVFAREGDTIERRVGPVGRQMMGAYRGVVGAVVRAGINVIVDEVLLSEEDWFGWQEVLRGLDALWVRIDVDLAEVEARELARGDRVIGMARAQYDVVHRYPDYDLHVDTGVLDPAAAAEVVLAAAAARRERPRSAPAPGPSA